MKILLVMGVKYLPARGGAQKYNASLLEGLARRGHTCRVVAQCLSTPEIDVHTKFLAGLAAEGIEAHCTPDVDRYTYHGVELHTVKVSTRLPLYLTEQLREFDPTWVLVSEDWSNLFGAVWAAGPERILYVVQSSANIPVGPLSFVSNPAKQQQFQKVAGVITVSDYLWKYVRQWSGRDAEVIPFMAYGAGPFPNYQNYAAGYVMFINPSAIKGMSLFLALARRMPEVAFAAVPTWGTTSADQVALEALPNVTLLAARDNVEELYAQTSALLVPSLWDEAFGAVVVEAMLRGIPVLASNVGGLPEAKLGVPYVLPVSPIERYTDEVDERGVPVPIVPAQDAGPWEAALRELLSERERYEQLSRQSREAAQAWVGTLGVERFERYLIELAARPQPPLPVVETALEGGLALERLSEERRRLLGRRLRRHRLVNAPKPAPVNAPETQEG
jgi:glycosyltransferase involved in cell wall biosynthesis